MVWYVNVGPFENRAHSWYYRPLFSKKKRIRKKYAKRLFTEDTWMFFEKEKHEHRKPFVKNWRKFNEKHGTLCFGPDRKVFVNPHWKTGNYTKLGDYGLLQPIEDSLPKSNSANNNDYELKNE